MRTHLTYITIIAVMAGVIFSGYRTLRKHTEARLAAENNLKSALTEVTEYSGKYEVTRKQYEELFAVHSAQAKKDGITRVINHEVIKYEYLIDTVMIPVPSEDDQLYDNTFAFYEDCLLAEVMIPVDGPPNLVLSGEIPINKYTFLRKKPRWFLRGLWFKGKWEPVTKVTTPCRMKLIENDIIEIKE